MQPLFSFFEIELPRFDSDKTAEFADLDAYFTEQVKSEVVSVVSDVVKKYAKTPCDIEVFVNISEDRSINIEQVRLIFDKNAVYDVRLEKELEAFLGIRPEIVMREEE
ncbi:MAG: hypothetical protein IJS90_07060 [Clostridia bacterium]|nr:hypothetical protein [Clostridia bacterium]